jgi:hypothetical protein
MLAKLTLIEHDLAAIKHRLKPSGDTIDTLASQRAINAQLRLMCTLLICMAHDKIRVRMIENSPITLMRLAQCGKLLSDTEKAQLKLLGQMLGIEVSLTS